MFRYDMDPSLRSGFQKKRHSNYRISMALSPAFAGVVLSAGASTRMGRDKALLPWRGGTFLSAAIRALQPLTDLVIVVAGTNAAQLAPVVNANAAFMVTNPNPER